MTDEEVQSAIENAGALDEGTIQQLKREKQMTLDEQPEELIDVDQTNMSIGELIELIELNEPIRFNIGDAQGVDGEE